MNDWELYEIVKDHKEAWPEDVRFTTEEAVPRVIIWGDTLPLADMAFEASFHRALLKRGDVYVTMLGESATVQVRDMDFTAASLIEAYAKALEWLK